MDSSTWTYAVAGLIAALIAVRERFGSAPMAAVQGTGVFFAGLTSATAHVPATNADARFRPRDCRR